MVYISGRVDIDSYLCLGVIVMSDQASADIREEVRARYAEAARAVLEPKTGVAASCCGSSGRGLMLRTGIGGGGGRRVQ